MTKSTRLISAILATGFFTSYSYQSYANECDALISQARELGINVESLLQEAVRERQFINKVHQMHAAGIAGGLYEIGAGGGTYQIFTRAGGSSKIIIGAASDYSKALSDRIYEPVIINDTRVYVHRDRLAKMLDVRFAEIKSISFDAAKETHLTKARKFVFADTVGIVKDRPGRGWLGIRYESGNSQVTEIKMYVQTKGALAEQRRSLAELGVNSVAIAASNAKSEGELVGVLLDGLDRGSVKIDYLEASAGFDNLSLNLELMRSGTSSGFIIDPTGRVGSASIFDYQQSQLKPEQRSAAVSISAATLTSTQQLRTLLEQNQGSTIIVRP
jgi:hypothetical protein